MTSEQPPHDPTDSQAGQAGSHAIDRTDGHAIDRRAEVKAGLIDVWPVALSMVPLGLAFGLLITQVGFAWWWAPIFSFVIYAGSMEFLAVSLVTAGVGPLSAALYGLLVNFRHVFYALNYPLRNITSRLGRLYGVYSLTDETYAVLSTKNHQAWTGPRVIAAQVLLQIGWVGGGILGSLFGQALPFEIKGMEFALIALFTVLAIEAFKTHRDVSLPITALITGFIGLVVSPSNMLMIGMTLYFLLLILRYVAPGVDKILTWGTNGGAHVHR
ncbi:AzlC family ABC transporter permease [Corynebacterium sp. zg254]